MTTPERIRALVRPFRAELRDEDVRRAAVYVAHQRVAEDYRVGRCFLVGDAAHLMPPFAGQGLNAGVRDATNVAWKLVEAVRGGARERLLDTYAVERRTHGAAMVTISRRIGAVVMATNPVVTRLRDVVVRAVSVVPSVREFLANMRFITPPDYADGVAVAPAPGVPELPGVTVGRALAQPVVVDAGGAATGLDAHLGRGWAVLTVGGSAAAAEAALDPYWTAIGAQRVRVLPVGETPADGAVPAVVETSAALAPRHLDRPVHVLVRPDRYVAAVFTAADEERVVIEMRGFIDDRARTAAQPAPDRLGDAAEPATDHDRSTT